MPDPPCQDPPDTRVFRTGLLPDGVLLPVTRPPVSSDMDVTDRVPATAPSSAVQVPQGPETEIIPPVSDTAVMEVVTEVVTEASPVSPEHDTPHVRDARITRPALSPVWTLEDVASHYKTSTRTIRRWIKDPAKAPVRLHALLGDDGAEAVPLQVTGNLPPLRKAGEDDPDGIAEPDTTVLVQTPREADLTEIIEGLSYELNQQYREQISRLIAERDAERDARLKAEIRAALAEDRADRASSIPLLAPPADEPRLDRLGHLLAAFRIR